MMVWWVPRPARVRTSRVGGCSRPSKTADGGPKWPVPQPSGRKPGRVRRTSKRLRGAGGGARRASRPGWNGCGARTGSWPRTWPHPGRAGHHGKAHALLELLSESAEPTREQGRASDGRGHRRARRCRRGRAPRVQGRRPAPVHALLASPAPSRPCRRSGVHGRPTRSARTSGPGCGSCCAIRPSWTRAPAQVWAHLLDDVAWINPPSDPTQLQTN
jgi:hypothetical protein